MKEIETVTVGSLETLFEEMLPTLGFQRSPVYRGQACESWSILPSLFRVEVARTEHSSWADVEAAFMMQWKHEAAADLAILPTTELEWMALAARHGLPTRLTNWSENIMVALYHATDPAHAGVDGVIWRILPGDPSFMIGQDYEQLPDAPRLYRPLRPDHAMRNQRTCFLSHPLPTEDAAPETFEECYELGSDRIVLTKLLIPADAKEYLRRRIATMGVDHRAMNPGLAGLSGDLRDRIYCHTDAYEWIYPQ